VKTGRTFLAGLIGLPLLLSGMPALADSAVRFEPAVMGPGAQVQYVEVAKKHRRHRRRHHRKTHSEVIVGHSGLA
jgi:hypothetical protein